MLKIEDLYRLYLIYRVYQKCGNPLIFRKLRIFKKNVSYKSYRVLCGALHSNIIMTSNSVVKVM